MIHKIIANLEKLTGRRIRHLTPRYLLDRIRSIIYELIHPNMPWLAPDAFVFISALLRSGDQGLEYGSGRSTVWFASKTRHLTSVEHSPDWHARVFKMLRINPCRNVRQMLIRADEKSSKDINKIAYLTARGETGRVCYDYILIDGLYRDLCANVAIRALRPGGLLIVDNIQWYLPSITCTPGGVTRPASKSWRKFSATVSTWRNVRFSNGITDTAIWIKP